MRVNIVIRDGDMEILASVTGVVATNEARAKKMVLQRKARLT
jgi:hypothetical protein